MMEKTDQSSTSPPNRNPDHVHAIGEEAGALLGRPGRKVVSSWSITATVRPISSTPSRKAHVRPQRPWKAMTALACRGT